MDLIACLNYLHNEIFKRLEELMRDVMDELLRMERNCEFFLSVGTTGSLILHLTNTEILQRSTLG